MCWQEREKYAEFVTTTKNEAMVHEVIATGHILEEQKSDLMWPDWLPLNFWNLWSTCEYGAAESGLSKYITKNVTLNADFQWFFSAMHWAWHVGPRIEEQTRRDIEDQGGAERGFNRFCALCNQQVSRVGSSAILVFWSPLEFPL